MPEETSVRFSTANKVGVIIALFITIIAVLVLLIQVQMNILVAVRAYIAAEGMWAKSQKDACRSLEHYALFRDEDDYKSYLRFIQVPLGDSKSRIELQKPNPNFDVAREGFLKGGNHPEDIEHMIDFFARFQNISYMSEAIAYWTKGDQYITELNSEAQKLHEEITSGAYNHEAVRGLLARLDLINQHLTAQENLFSLTLAKASRWVNDVSRKITYGIAFLFALLGIGISWPFVTNIRNIEIKLLRSRNDLRIAATAFESQESLMITDAEGVILRVNKAFTDCTGYLAEDVLGQTPRILKSGRHDKAFYTSMWQSLQHTGIWQGEVWDRRKNGDIYPKWLSISAVKGDDGVVTHYVGSHVDITVRKKTESEIAEQVDELRRWHAVTSNREGRILELKHEINDILGQIGQPSRYPSAESENPTEK